MEQGCELWDSSGGGYIRGTVMMEVLKCVVERVEGEAAGRVWVGGEEVSTRSVQGVSLGKYDGTIYIFEMNFTE